VANLHKRLQITLREKSPCEFAIAVSCEIGSFNTLNKTENCAYKARADWLNYFYRPWESAGHKINSPNNQLCLTWNLIWASLGPVIIGKQETISIHENQSVGGDYKMLSDRIYLRVAPSWVRLWAQLHTWFLMTVQPETEPRYGTNYAVNREVRNPSCDFFEILRLGYRKIVHKPLIGIIFHCPQFSQIFPNSVGKASFLLPSITFF